MITMVFLREYEGCLFCKTIEDNILCFRRFFEQKRTLKQDHKTSSRRSSSSPNMTQDTKQLIGNMMNEKLANSPTKASSHWLAEADGQCNIVPVIDKEPQLTPWERLADAILRKPFPLTHSSKSASIESLTTDTIEI